MALQDATNPMQGVSGPGKFAKRTDLEYQSPEYGAGVEMAQQMQAAPLATSPSPTATPASIIRRDAERAASKGVVADQTITSLYAPTQRPDEPVTHGVDIGAGLGSEILNMPNQAQAQYATAYQLINQWASSPDASPTMQYLAQRIKQGF